jgi:hypothetical protein
MKVFANWKLPIYQVLGPTVRVHWGYSHEIDEETGDDRWSAYEVAMPIDVDRKTFVDMVIEAGGDGEMLAAGWFKS